MPTAPSAGLRAEPPVDHRPPGPAAWRSPSGPKGYSAAFGTAAGAVMVMLDLASI